MTNKTISTRNSKTPKNDSRSDDSLLSRNHSKNIRYRLRVKEAKEAEEDIKKYKDNTEKYEQGL